MTTVFTTLFIVCGLGLISTSSFAGVNGSKLIPWPLSSCRFSEADNTVSPSSFVMFESTSSLGAYVYMFAVGILTRLVLIKLLLTDLLFLEIFLYNLGVKSLSFDFQLFCSLNS